MIRPVTAIVLAVIVAAAWQANAAAQSASSGGLGQPVASKELLNVLAAIQKLDATGQLAMHVWAREPTPQAPDPIMTPLDQVETDIALNLSPADRRAVLAWLGGGGRAKLYAQYATDSDIGPCIGLVDSANCTSQSSAGSAGLSSTPAQFRSLTFSLASGSEHNGGISIERGFAVIKSDGTLQTYCLSFKNDGSKKADAVTFVFRIQAQSGEVVYAGSNVRAGSFDPGAEVVGPLAAENLAGLSSDGPGKELLANCWTRNTAALPALLRADHFTVGVAAVTYEDGTNWARGQ